MAYRLSSRTEGGIRRKLLTPGENLVGSAESCDFQIDHPSISRFHAAVLLVDGGDAVEVADLGSRNGTHVDGVRIRRPARVAPGQRLDFGSVQAWVEAVDDGDAESAKLPDAAAQWAELPATHDSPNLAAGAATGSHTTASVGPLSVFMLGSLPGLATALAQGVPNFALAQRAGAALLEALPCRKVEISCRGRQLFTGEAPDRAGSRTSTGSPTRAEVAGTRVTVELVDEATGQLLSPLLETTAALVSAAGRATETSAVRVQVRAAEKVPVPDPPSVVPAVKLLYERARKVARGDINVMILGESGTGKELLARFLHAASNRSDAPFVAMNCAALAKDLQESELFGIEKGVATGVEARAGLFESAHGGTLFLDEIGDMALDVQAKILRALQQKEVFRLGGSTARPADVRVVSATHRDVPVMIEDGDFRTDLFHRIADWQARLPPLRERSADIGNLAAYFLAQAAAASAAKPAGFSKIAWSALRKHRWPGNIRQLEREIKRAVLFVEEGELLDSSCLSPDVLAAAEEPSPQSLKAAVEQAERGAVQDALAATEGDVPAAAEALEVPVSTLYRKIKTLGGLDVLFRPSPTSEERRP